MATTIAAAASAPAPSPCAAAAAAKPLGAGASGGARPGGGGPLRFVELFAGIGGFRVALERLGMQCVFASEIEGQARATYKLNWPDDGRGPSAGATPAPPPEKKKPPMQVAARGDAATGAVAGAARSDFAQHSQGPCPPPPAEPKRGGRRGQRRPQQQLLHGDITAVPDADFPAHDLLCGGFPCQPFTRLGAQAGVGHRRGKLYLEILRVLRLRRPAMFLLENVPGLATTQMTPRSNSSGGGSGDGGCGGGRAEDADSNELVLSVILRDLAACGYRVAWKLVDSAALLPQTRKRVYIVGFSTATGVGVPGAIPPTAVGADDSTTCGGGDCGHGSSVGDGSVGDGSGGDGSGGGCDDSCGGRGDGMEPAVVSQFFFPVLPDLRRAVREVLHAPVPPDAAAEPAAATATASASTDAAAAAGHLSATSATTAASATTIATTATKPAKRQRHKALHAARRAAARRMTPRQREVAAMRACRLAPAQWARRLDLGAPAHFFFVLPHLPAVTLTKSYRQTPGRQSARRFAEAAALRRRQAAEKRQAAAAAAAAAAGAVVAVPTGLATPAVGGRDASATDVTARAHTNPKWGWHNLVPWAWTDAGVAGGDVDVTASAAAAAAQPAPPPRYYTARECARLQGFPESFRIAREVEDPNGPHAALFGNAVSPPVVAAVAGAMLASLRRARARGAPFACTAGRNSSGGGGGNGSNSVVSTGDGGRRDGGCGIGDGGDDDGVLDDDDNDGLDTALAMLVEAVPPEAVAPVQQAIDAARAAARRRRRRLRQRRQRRQGAGAAACSSSDSGGGGTGEGGSGSDADAAATPTAAPQVDVCFKWRDEGACTWGAKCRWRHHD